MFDTRRGRQREEGTITQKQTHTHTCRKRQRVEKVLERETKKVRDGNRKNNTDRDMETQRYEEETEAQMETQRHNNYQRAEGHTDTL